MAKAKKVISNNNLLLALVFIILGVCLMLGGFGAAQSMSSILFTVMGIVLIVLGVLSAVAGLIPVAVIQLLLGILMVVFAWTLTWIAFLVIGIFLLVTGIQGLGNKRSSKLVSILDFVIGLLLILRAFGYYIPSDWGAWVATLLNVLTIVAGALLAVDGVLILIGRKK